MTVYALTLTDTELSYEDYSEDFGIGIFSSYEKAEETAKAYLHHVPGFCEYPCIYRITEKHIVGADVLPEAVWMVCGWNTNDHLDETDIVESDCYCSEQEALLALEAMQQRYSRTEWAVNRFRIDKREWQEGFCRV